MGGQHGLRKRILVVDDDVRTTQIFAQMLREDGHDVAVAHDGTAAIAYLRQATIPDVLVTDIQMPLADGFAVARYAREREPLLPIFFVTGYPERVSRRVNSLDPEPHVFVKPLDYAALMVELSSAALLEK
jgi:CheY-like chemotaxis protein